MADLQKRKAPEAYPSLVVQQLDQIETDLGGRGALVGLLTLAPLSPDLRYILGLLGDPRNSGKPLATICAQGNVLPGELIRHLGSAALLRGKVLAQQAIGNGIAAVTQDLMLKAAPYDAPCYGCRGLGKVTTDPTPKVPNPGPEDCLVCLGTGELRYQPDLERQKLAIEMAHLLPKGGGLQILNQQIGGAAGGVSGSGGGALEQMQQLTDQLLYGDGGGLPPRPAEVPADPVEGEVVDGDGTPES